MHLARIAFTLVLGIVAGWPVGPGADASEGLPHHVDGWEVYAWKSDPKKNDWTFALAEKGTLTTPDDAMQKPDPLYRLSEVKDLLTALKRLPKNEEVRLPPATSGPAGSGTQLTFERPPDQVINRIKRFGKANRLRLIDPAE